MFRFFSGFAISRGSLIERKNKLWLLATAYVAGLLKYFPHEANGFKVLTDIRFYQKSRISSRSWENRIGIIRKFLDTFTTKENKAALGMSKEIPFVMTNRFFLISVCCALDICGTHILVYSMWVKNVINSRASHNKGAERRGLWDLNEIQIIRPHLWEFQFGEEGEESLACHSDCQKGTLYVNSVLN